MNSIEIGKFISNLRKEKGYTQMALAELLNVSNRTVSKWENGDGYPDITLLPEIASALGVTVDELLNAEKAPETEKTSVQSEEDKAKYKSRVCFILSAFVGAFGALLGVGNKVYCAWAFSILYYTHWEIIFDAVSFVALAVSALGFMLGIFELNHNADRDYILQYCKNRISTSLKYFALWSAFPLAYLTRLFCLVRIGSFYFSDLAIPFVIFICVIYVIANVFIYIKYSKK